VLQRESPTANASLKTKEKGKPLSLREGGGGFSDLIWPSPGCQKKGRGKKDPILYQGDVLLQQKKRGGKETLITTS